MPTKKELIDKIKKEKLISKGLTKLSKKELEEFASKGMHSSDMLKKAGNMVKSKRLKMLKLMTKKKLLKLISTIRIKNYSNLSHKELIEVIATKHWGDFHSKWVTASKSDKSLLPNYHPKELEDKSEKLDRTLKGKVIKPQIAEVQEIKKRGPQKAPPKRPAPKRTAPKKSSSLTDKENKILDELQDMKSKGKIKNPDVLEYLMDVVKVGRKKATDKVERGDGWMKRFDKYFGPGVIMDNTDPYVKNLRFEVYGSKQEEATEPTKFGKIVKKITDKQIKKVLLENVMKPDNEDSIKVIKEGGTRGEINFAVEDILNQYLGSDRKTLMKDKNKFDEEIEGELRDKVIKVARELMKNSKLTTEEREELNSRQTDIERKMELKLIMSVGRGNITASMKKQIKKEADKQEKAKRKAFWEKRNATIKAVEKEKKEKEKAKAKAKKDKEKAKAKKDKAKPKPKTKPKTKTKK